MIKSMTGFGRFETTSGDRKVTVEMKSVNHRYLELGIKLPKKLNFLENKIRNEIKKYIERGKVDVFITYENLGEGSECIRYNSALAKEYFDVYQKISEELGVENDIKASHIMKSQDVITIEAEADDETVIEEMALETICGAAEKLVASRIEEGERLKTDLISKLEEMLQNVKFVEQKSPEIVEEYREKILEKIHTLLEDNQIDENRIAQEVVMFADKVCVDEEIVRLYSHISGMKDALEKGGVIGRRLDFIAQEMNREANTTLSKTTNDEIAEVAIEIKTAIEKVREQIQNIE
ncbi:MAG: YicC family protein [Eubacterium sp.]|nr:YicC family protein [Eubacterium sp.]